MKTTLHGPRRTANTPTARYLVSRGLTAEAFAADVRASTRYPLRLTRVTVQRWTSDSHAVDEVYAHAVWTRHPECPLRLRGTKRWITKAQHKATPEG